jgi:hypothetical protein
MRKIFLLAFLFTATTSLAQLGTYGKCNYGEGIYNVGGSCEVFLAIKDITLTGVMNSRGKPELTYVVKANKDMAKNQIHRSTDGVNFTLLSTNSNMDNTINTKTYTFIDSSFDELPKVYYKVKGFDLAGNIMYSNIVFLSTDKNAVLKVYPNPVQANMKIKVSKEYLGTQINLQLLDANGKVVLNKIYNKINTTEELYVKGLANGLYTLQITTKKGKESTQINIQQ